MSGVCTCERNKTDGQIKGQKDRHGEEERWQEVRVAVGKAALSVWGSVGPTPHPNPGPQAVGQAASVRDPRSAAPGPEPHPWKGPVPAVPARPPGVAAARFRRAGTQCTRMSNSSVRGARRGVGGGQARRTYPLCCGTLSAGRGAPKGRAVLLRETLGAKMYRGDSAAGACAWAETERCRACGGNLGWPGRLTGAERTAALQPRPRTSGGRLPGGGHLGAQLSYPNG